MYKFSTDCITLQAVVRSAMFIIHLECCNNTECFVHKMNVRRNIKRLKNKLLLYSSITNLCKKQILDTFITRRILDRTYIPANQASAPAALTAATRDGADPSNSSAAAHPIKFINSRWNSLSEEMSVLQIIWFWGQSG